MAGWNQLSFDNGLRNTALFEFLLLPAFEPVFLPILIAIPQCGNEGEASRRPELDGGERERGGKIQSRCEHAGADDVCAGNIQVMDKEIADNAAQETFNRDGMHPAEIAGE